MRQPTYMPGWEAAGRNFAGVWPTEGGVADALHRDRTFVAEARVSIHGVRCIEHVKQSED